MILCELQSFWKGGAGSSLSVHVFDVRVKPDFPDQKLAEPRAQDWVDIVSYNEVADSPEANVCLSYRVFTSTNAQVNESSFAEEVF